MYSQVSGFHWNEGATLPSYTVSHRCCHLCSIFNHLPIPSGLSQSAVLLLHVRSQHLRHTQVLVQQASTVSQPIFLQHLSCPARPSAFSTKAAPKGYSRLPRQAQHYDHPATIHQAPMGIMLLHRNHNPLKHRLRGLRSSDTALKQMSKVFTPNLTV